MAYKDPEKRKAANDRQRDKMRAKRLADPEAYREMRRAAYAKNPEKWLAKNEQRRQKRRADPLKLAQVRAYARNYQRQLRLADPAKHKAKQRAYAGLPAPTRLEPTYCECCGKLPDKKGMCLDHCHVTGCFRGFLCHKCNTAIAMLGDAWWGIYAAIDYLFRNGFGPI